MTYSFRAALGTTVDTTALFDNGGSFNYIGRQEGRIEPFEGRKADKVREIFTEAIVNKYYKQVVRRLDVIHTKNPFVKYNTKELMEKMAFDIFTKDYSSKLERTFSYLRDDRVTAINDNFVQGKSQHGYRSDGKTVYASLIDYVEEALNHHSLGENPKFIKQLVIQFYDDIPFDRTRIKVSKDCYSDGANITLRRRLMGNETKEKVGG